MHLDLAASEGTQDCWLVVPAIIAEVKLNYAKKPNDTNRQECDSPALALLKMNFAMEVSILNLGK